MYKFLKESKTGKEIQLELKSWLTLAKKAGKSNVPLSVIEQVYVRGLLESNPQSKNSPEQQAFNRVNSFLHEGKAYELDYDLIMEAPKVPDGRKHMGIIKDAVRRYETKDEPQQIDEVGFRSIVPPIVGLAVNAAKAINRKRKYGSFSRDSVEYLGQQRANRKKANIRSNELVDKWRSDPGRPGASNQGKSANQEQEQGRDTDVDSQDSNQGSHVSRTTRKFVDVQKQKSKIKDIFNRYKSKQHAHMIHKNREAGGKKASELLSPDFARDPETFRKKEAEEKASSTTGHNARKQTFRKSRQAFNKSQTGN